jgi:hypothetical protein
MRPAAISQTFAGPQLSFVCMQSGERPYTASAVLSHHEPLETNQALGDVVERIARYE